MEVVKATKIAGVAADWGAYLRRFHAERAGITEAVLSGATDDRGFDPYAWVAEAVPTEGRVVDVACGSAPLAPVLGGRWAGLDASAGELALAADRAPGRVVLGDAASLPLPDGCAAGVVCAMALMLLDPPGPALVECHRVLASGGRLVALLPASTPLGVRDRLRYGRLLLALGERRLPFPGPGLLDGAGLRVVADERRRFALPLRHEAAADRFVDSLYLPATDAAHVRRGRAVARRWVGSELGLPLRRLVAVPAS